MQKIKMISSKSELYKIVVDQKYQKKEAKEKMRINAKNYYEKNRDKIVAKKELKVSKKTLIKKFLMFKNKYFYIYKNIYKNLFKKIYYMMNKTWTKSLCW